MSPVPVQNVLDLIEAAVVLVGIVTIGFSTVGAIAVWREGKQGAGSFFRMFERLQVLQLLTVMLVIAAATLLGLFGILDSTGSPASSAASRATCWAGSIASLPPHRQCPSR